VIEPTSNSAQRHWGIQPMRGEGDHFGPNSGPRPPGTWRYQVGLSGLTALSSVRSQGQSGKHILLLSFFGFGRVEMWRGGFSLEPICCPPLSSGGALVVQTWLRFHIPLIEPDRRISRIRLS